MRHHHRRIAPAHVGWVLVAVAWLLSTAVALGLIEYGRWLERQVVGAHVEHVSTLAAEARDEIIRLEQAINTGAACVDTRR